jgi:hypothetical protein
MNFYPKKPKYVHGYIKTPFSLMKLFFKNPPKKKKKESLGNMEVRRSEKERSP